ALETVPRLDHGDRPARLRQVDVDRRSHPRGDPVALCAVAAARDHGHPDRRAAGDPARRHRRAQAGHVGGLRRADRVDRRAGDALVLARHRLHPRTPDRLQVASAHGLYAALGGPLAEPPAAHLAGTRGRLPVLGGRHAHDAFGDARGVARGLHPHGPGQGTLGEAHPLAPRAQERDAAGAHRDRARVRLPDGRARRDRAGVQPQRARSPLRRGGGPPRLHAHAGARDARRVRLHLRELPGRPGVRLDRPADTIPVMAVKPAVLGDVPEVAERGNWRRTVLDFCRARPLGAIGAVVVSILGTGIGNLLVAITIPMIPRAALVARSSALAIREMPYVDAARAAGFSHRRIILRHMLPNVMAPYLIMLTAYLGQAILLEASLSFLGLGVAEPTPAWGLMLRGAAVQFAESAPWMAIFPGFAISLAVFAFNLFGDSLRDALDPRLRTQ